MRIRLTSRHVVYAVEVEPGSHHTISSGVRRGAEIPSVDSEEGRPIYDLVPGTPLYVYRHDTREGRYVILREDGTMPMESTTLIADVIDPAGARYRRYRDVCKQSHLTLAERRFTERDHPYVAGETCPVGDLGAWITITRATPHQYFAKAPSPRELAQAGVLLFPDDSDELYLLGQPVPSDADLPPAPRKRPAAVVQMATPVAAEPAPAPAA